jgi:twitching motility protein PilT
MDLDALLLHAIERGASDVHLKVGRPPVLRDDGTLKPLEDWPDLDAQTLEAVLAQVTASVPKKLTGFHDTGELDIAYTGHDLPRFRVNGFRQRGSTSFAFRAIPDEVPTFDKLGLPPGVQRLAAEDRGLVLVTGATGSGKTNTLAAMIGHINATRSQHIVTIEDPIEVVHPDVGCIVNQREVGLDTESFSQALRRVLRQDPDVILIGELRDAETAQTALQAAESGHLVFSTLHTIDAAETVSRLVEFFPPLKQQQIKSILGGVLRGVISQRLLPRVDGGRVAAVEVMVMNARIAELVREGRSDEIEDAIADGEFMQMQTFRQALIALAVEGKVDREVAAAAATNKHDFLVALEQEEKRQRAGEQQEEHDDDEPEAAAGDGEEPPAFLLRKAEPEPVAEHENGTVPEFALRTPEAR